MMTAKLYFTASMEAPTFIIESDLPAKDLDSILSLSDITWDISTMGEIRDWAAVFFQAIEQEIGSVRIIKKWTDIITSIPEEIHKPLTPLAEKAVREHFGRVPRVSNVTDIDCERHLRGPEFQEFVSSLKEIDERRKAHYGDRSYLVWCYVTGTDMRKDGSFDFWPASVALPSEIPDGEVLKIFNLLGKQDWILGVESDSGMSEWDEHHWTNHFDPEELTPLFDNLDPSTVAFLINDLRFGATEKWADWLTENGATTIKSCLQRLDSDHPDAS